MTIFDDNFLLLIGTFLTGVSLFLLLRALVYEKSLAKAHNIAFIGPQKSGKTTIITTIFNEIFSRQLKGFKATPTGMDTIKRVNLDARNIEEGLPLGPTTTQNTFAYSANMSVGKLLSRNYKVQFGDFPGHVSEEFYKTDKLVLLSDQEFFKWVSSADAFVFIIDIAEYLISKSNDKAYVSVMTANIRAAWQKLVYLHDNSVNKFENKPLVLSFNKSDLFSLTPKPIQKRYTGLKKKILKFGFEEYPGEVFVDEESFEVGKENIKSDFSDLINYLTSVNNKFQVIFTSSFGYIEERRIGVKELLEAVLPNELYYDVGNRFVKDIVDFLLKGRDLERNNDSQEDE